MSEGTTSNGRHFFSLKWKAVLLLSLILILVNTGLAGLGYVQLKRQFTHQQEQLRRQQVQELEALLDSSFQELEQLASMVPHMAPDGPQGRSISSQLLTVFREQSSTLEFDWGLDGASFYGPDNQLLFSWRPLEKRGRYLSMIQEVNQTEQPDHRLECRDLCRQLVAVPILKGTRMAGVLLLSRPLADVIISFREITDADIAIVEQQRLAVGKGPTARLLPGWRRKVLAVTRAQTNLPLLREAAALHPFEELLTAPVEIEHSGHTFILQLVPMYSDEERTLTYFIVINDITPQVQQINRATQRSLGFGLIGFLLSESLLLLLLWHPLNRLLRLSESLPLLAQNAYDKVRKQLGTGRHDGFKDEIDIASETTLELANTLETLHLEVQAQTHHLVARGEELSRERDFVTGLLNSAQVIILTQDNLGNLLSLNPEGRRFFGQEQGEQFNFFERVSIRKIDDQLFRMAMEDLKAGKIQVYQHDGTVIGHDGRHHSISWIHSRLPGQQEVGTASILSVGLDITDREEAEQRLSWLANHDPLTELYNRRHFQQALDGLLSQAQRYGHRVALLFFDLDQFKYLNDTSGHQAGDAMLRVVAERLVKLTRTSDLLARLGGDEFALVVPETDIEGACQVADKILDDLRQITLPTKGRTHRVSASIGIVIFPDHGASSQDLMSNADLAMYQAKESGRDRWHLFALNEQMREQTSQRLTWKEKIEQALSEDGFLLYYQPIMEIRSGQISHYEVLIRMREEDGTIIPPGEFIPVAERTGLIHSIDRLVLREAIGKLAQLSKCCKREINLSVNLSGRVVDDPELLPLLKELLKLSDVNPQHLVFELTETATLADMASAEQLMRELRVLGCRFAMDDFGVGFSSFYYLRELPLDIVKIDGSFIRQLPSSPEDRIFVKALTEMASGLKKKTIAEFVEDRETLDLLKEIGVDYAQGYYIGKPLPEILPAADPVKSSAL